MTLKNRRATAWEPSKRAGGREALAEAFHVKHIDTACSTLYSPVILTSYCPCLARLRV